MNSDRNKQIFTIDFLIVIIFAFYYILPSVSEKYSFLLPLALGYVYILFNVMRKDMKLSIVIVKYFAVITFVALLYMLLTDASSIAADVSGRGLKRFLSKVYQMTMMFFPLYFLKRIVNNLSYKGKKILLICSYTLIAYVILTTMRELIVDPDITRAWAEFEESSTDNIANYYFVYAIPFTIVISTMIVCKTRHMLVRIAMIGVIMYQMYFLLLAQYTLSVLTAIIGMCVEIYINVRHSRNKTLLILLFATLAIMSPWLFKMAASHVPSEQMSIRLYEIYYFLVGGDTSGYNMNGRMILYGESIKAFLKSPLWGNRTLAFDGHATFLTVLSDLGLIGGIPFYYLYFSSRKRVRKIIDEKGNSYMPIFLMLMLMGFTNPIHSALPLMYVVWFLAPLTIETYKEYEEMKYGIMGN